MAQAAFGLDRLGYQAQNAQHYCGERVRPSSDMSRDILADCIGHAGPTSQPKSHRETFSNLCDPSNSRSTTTI